MFTWKITNDFYLTFNNKSSVDQPTPLLRDRFSLLRMDSLPSEFSLKCNVLKCSRKLIDEAWITSCGHIFCVDCGSVKLDQLPVLCPRCSTHFSSPFDVMISDLNPPSHFKKVKTTCSLNLVNPSCQSSLRTDGFDGIVAKRVSFCGHERHRFLDETNVRHLQQLRNVCPFCSCSSHRHDQSL